MHFDLSAFINTTVPGCHCYFPNKVRLWRICTSELKSQSLQVACWGYTKVQLCWTLQWTPSRGHQVPSRLWLQETPTTMYCIHLHSAPRPAIQGMAIHSILIQIVVTATSGQVVVLKITVSDLLVPRHLAALPQSPPYVGNMVAQDMMPLECSGWGRKRAQWVEYRRTNRAEFPIYPRERK